MSEGKQASDTIFLMDRTPKETFDWLLNIAKEDPNIIGFFLGGSRGKGYETDSSDYDPKMIVRDEVANEYKEKYDTEWPGVDSVVSSISEFRNYANWQSDTHWDRYDHTHVTALVDKTGEIQKLVNEKGSIPSEKKKGFIGGEIDAYINHFFRSIKSHTKKDEMGAHLSAGISISHALNILFALHNRSTPFNDYLTRELKNKPLEKLPINSEELMSAILKILKTADMKAQQDLARTIEALARQEGFGQTFDDWGGKDKWAMNYTEQ